MVFFIIFLALDLEISEAISRLYEIRGERLSLEVKLALIGEEELEGYLNEALFDTFGRDLKGFEKVLNFLNITKGSYSELALSLYKSQAAGFYNPKDKTLKVMEGIKDDGFILDNVLIHELSHALQDEKIGIYKEMQRRSFNYDSLLALQTFLEGEATLITIASAGSLSLIEGFDDLFESSLEIGEEMFYFLSEDDNFLFYEMLIPYTKGLSFVLYNLRKGNWEQINKIYKRLPCTMEEILHFEKEHRPPKDFKKIAGKLRFKGFKKTFSTTFGESFIYFIFSKYFGRDEAFKKAEGWDGDLLLSFEKEDKIILAWFLSWDTEEDLSEALEGFKEFSLKEGLKFMPFYNKKDMLLIFHREEKIGLDPQIFNIIKKMEVLKRYECKSK